MTFKANISSTSRDFYFTPAGNNDLAGVSLEVALSDPQEAINRVNALIPPADGANPASINASVTGSYQQNITLPSSTSVSCAFASLLNFVPAGVNVTAGNTQESQWGAILNFADNGTCYLINDNTRHEAIVNAFVVSGDDGVCVTVSGTCDDIFLACVQSEIRGERAKAIHHTATSVSPVNYNISLTELFGIDQTFMVHNPPLGSSQTVMNCPTVQTDQSSITTGSMIFKCQSGILVVISEVLSAEMIADVSDAAILTLSAQVVAGNTIVKDTGICIYKSMSLLNGDAEVQGTGSFQVDATNITGNLTNAGSMTVNTPSLVGDIVNNGVMVVNIGAHSGTVTNNGVINGIIGGIRYGDQTIDFPVDSVNGETGVVVLDGTEIELIEGGAVTVTQAVFDINNTKADRIGDTLIDAIVNGVTLSNAAFFGYYLNGVGNYVQVNNNHVINGSNVSGLYTDDALNNLDAKIPSTEVVVNGDSFVNQNPAGLDTPMQVTYGAAQAPWLDAAGAITIQDDGQYDFKFAFQYGRTGGGGVSWIFFRILKNGAQIGTSTLAKLDGANDDIPAEFAATLDLLTSDVITVEIVRDSVGNNSGGLITSSPTLAWTDAPSASITVKRRILI